VNIRDYANIAPLVCLVKLENLNHSLKRLTDKDKRND